MASYELRTLKDVMDAIDEEKQLDPGLISDEEKRRFIQDALDDLGDLGLFEDVYTFTGMNPIDLSRDSFDNFTGFQSIVNVYYKGRVVNPVSPRDINIEQTGNDPQGYWLVGTKLFLWPAPTENVTILVELNKRPVWPADLGDEIDLPMEWRRLLVLYGTHRCHKKNGNVFSANDYLNEYERLKGSLVNQAMQRRNSRVTAISRREPFDGLPWGVIRGG